MGFDNIMGQLMAKHHIPECDCIGAGRISGGVVAIFVPIMEIEKETPVGVECNCCSGRLVAQVNRGEWNTKNLQQNQ